MIVANGRYGPYVRRGKESRSLETEEQMFTITLDEALAKLAEPRTRGRRAAAPPLRELGDDPVSGKPVVLKEGRFGPYVTDGETNASLRAVATRSNRSRRSGPRELLQARRERGPAKKRATQETRLTGRKTVNSDISTAETVHNLDCRRRNARCRRTRSHWAVPWPAAGRSEEPSAETKGHRVPLDSEPADRTA